MAAILGETKIFWKLGKLLRRDTLRVKNFVKLSSGQASPSKKDIFGHVTSLIGWNVTAAYSKKFPRATA